jgi:hypothetical protein
MDGLSEMLLTDWLRSDDDPEILDISNRVGYLERRLYDDYEPSQYWRFNQRLDKWLANLEEDHLRKTLYKLIGSLFFIGRQEFESLCRAAFHGPVTRWLIDQLDLPFTDPDAEKKLSAAVERTWFCPVTDSMRINAFLKVTNLEGHKHRPDWKSLARFGDPKKIREFIRKENVERIVLLEDFVGTGTQMSTAVSYAAELIEKFPVICCPLIICPEGVTKGAALVDKYPNLVFEPVLTLPIEQFIKPEPQPFDTALFVAVRNLIGAIAARLRSTSGHATHGFEGTGALVVLYSNCPNNTLPIVHDLTNTWSPLFPRIRRR